MHSLDYDTLGVGSVVTKVGFTFASCGNWWQPIFQKVAISFSYRPLKSDYLFRDRLVATPTLLSAFKRPLSSVLRKFGRQKIIISFGCLGRSPRLDPIVTPLAVGLWNKCDDICMYDTQSQMRCRIELFGIHEINVHKFFRISWD